MECEIVSNKPPEFTALLYDMLPKFKLHFKAVCCTNISKSCELCHESTDCAYITIFSQQLSQDPEIVRLHQKPSLPFSLYIQDADKDSSIAVGITIIGSAINYLNYFYSALLAMIDEYLFLFLKNNSFNLHFYTLDYLGDRHQIRETSELHDNVILLNGTEVMLNTRLSDHIIISFKSPLSLLLRGLFLHQFDFAIFLRSQLRRCSSLYAYYGRTSLDLDYFFLSQAAANVLLLKNEIHYIRPLCSKKAGTSGLLGSAEFFELNQQMVSLLQLGSYFNSGKGASSGAGFYQLEAL